MYKPACKVKPKLFAAVSRQVVFQPDCNGHGGDSKGMLNPFKLKLRCEPQKGHSTKCEECMWANS